LWLVGVLEIYIWLKAIRKELNAKPEGGGLSYFEQIQQVLSVVVDLLKLIGDPFQLASNSLKDLLTDLTKLTGYDFTSIGSDADAGVSKGIQTGGPSVVSTMLGMLGGVVTAAQSMLGIHSPSRVFAGFGKNTAKGFAMGVDAGVPMAQSAMQTMVDPSKLGGATAPTKSGTTITIGTIEIHGDAKKEDVKMGVLEAFAQAFGPLQLEVGV
jgi:hypothetical protein